jgi:hypothetical protein
MSYKNKQKKNPIRIGRRTSILLKGNTLLLFGRVDRLPTSVNFCNGTSYLWPLGLHFLLFSLPGFFVQYAGGELPLHGLKTGLVGFWTASWP